MAEKPSKPKLVVPKTAEELIEIAKKRDESLHETFEIPEWGIAVRIKPASFVEWHRVVQEMQIQERSKNPRRALLEDMAWIQCCLVEPKLTQEDLEKLITCSSAPLLRLSTRCQVISGNLNEQFLEGLSALGEGLGRTEDSQESTPPA